MSNGHSCWPWLHRGASRAGWLIPRQEDLSVSPFFLTAEFLRVSLLFAGGVEFKKLQNAFLKTEGKMCRNMGADRCRCLKCNNAAILCGNSRGRKTKHTTHTHIKTNSRSRLKVHKTFSFHTIITHRSSEPEHIISKCG